MKIKTNHKKRLSNKISDVKSKVSDTIKKYEDNFTKKPDSEELKNPQETPDYIFAGWMNADKIEIVKKYIESRGKSQDESQGDTPTLFKVNQDKLEKITIDEDDEEAFKFIAKNLITKKYVYRKKNTDNNIIINKGKDLLDKGNNILKKRTDKIVYVIHYNT